MGGRDEGTKLLAILLRRSLLFVRIAVAVRNRVDRFHLVSDIVTRVGGLPEAAHVQQWIRDKLIDHKQYVVEHGIDMPEILDWKWQSES